MISSSSSSKPVCQNQLLGALPLREFDRLSVYLEAVKLKQGQILYEPDEAIDHIYFPEDCIISKITVFSDGSSVESGIIGREGMTGVSVALSNAKSSREACVQTPGESLRIKTADFQKALDSVEFSELVREYSLAFFEQVAQTGACSSHHPSHQRLARLLLMCHDRTDGDEFFITHESMAQMLGIYRPGVTASAIELKEKGLIDYARGRITILDRRRLEREACECYGVIKQIFRRYKELLDLHHLNSRMAHLNEIAAAEIKKRREIEGATAASIQSLQSVIKGIKSARAPYFHCRSCEMVRFDGQWITLKEFIGKDLPYTLIDTFCPECPRRG